MSWYRYQMCLEPDVIYPTHDPQYIALKKAVLQSQIIVTWTVPLPIIDVICGFSLGQFVECSSVDCTEQIHVFNVWQYKNHSDGVKLKFLRYKNKYYCIQCFYAKKLAICHMFNQNFILGNDDIVFMHNDSDKPLGCEDLCDEVISKKLATIKKCASGCSRE